MQDKNNLDVIDFDALTEMAPAAIITEFLFLNSKDAQEKDTRYGVCMGLSKERQVRLNELTSHILKGLECLSECEQNSTIS